MHGLGMQKIHRNISQRNRKSVVMVARCCRKTNQLQSVGGIENKEPIKIFVSQKKKKKKCCNLLPGDAEKLISCSLCRSMESKENHKNIYKSKKQKKVAMATLVARFAEKIILSSLCRGMKAKNPMA